jgi:hypothetical protein
MCGTFFCSELMNVWPTSPTPGDSSRPRAKSTSASGHAADAVGIGVAVGKGASAGTMRKPTASNAAPTKPAARFTVLDLPPDCGLGPIGANFMSGY